MYLRQKCPNCSKEKEFTYVEVGHTACCRNCNYEFKLEKKHFLFLPYLIGLVAVLIAAGIGYYVLKTFHDWWIYR